MQRKDCRGAGGQGGISKYPNAMLKTSSFSPAPPLLCTPAASTIFPFLSAILLCTNKIRVISRSMVKGKKSVAKMLAGQAFQP